MRNGVARLNPDGTLDAGFDPGGGATNAVWALAIQPDGLVLVGGSFTNFNGYPLSHIARLNLNGQVDSSFNIGAGTDDTVNGIVVQPDTRILLVGLFSHANGVSRSRITRLLPDGTVDPAINFGLGADNYIDAIALQPDGMMMVIGGGFTSYDGQSRPHLARVYGGSLAGSGLFRFTSANYQADEESGNAVLTVRRTGGTAGDMTVGFATVGLTAVPGVNFSNVQTTLDFPVGETFQTVLVPLIHDFQVTPDLVVSNYLSDPSSPAGIGGQYWALLTILNDDSTVSFSKDSDSVYQNGQFVADVVRQGSTRTSASVDFFTTTNGTAVADVDYAPTNITVAFQPGETDVKVPLTILNNRLAASDTTVVMQLLNPTNTLLTIPNQETLTILTTNNSAGRLMFSQPSYVVDKNAGFLVANVLLVNGHSGNIISVDFATTNNGTATASVDYVATNGSLSFQPGDTSKSFPVQILETNVPTGNLTFGLVLTNATGGATLAGPTTVPVTIVDDNVAVGFSFRRDLCCSETAGTVVSVGLPAERHQPDHDGPVFHHEPDRQCRHQLCRHHQRHAHLQPGRDHQELQGAGLARSPGSPATSSSR